ncbi:MAG TPA: pyridoxamine 5'-phosphate oxidase family protein [Gemmatimonadaceae bacterium]|nr:pyridoxamine 5'-phosphate oxidase family protein [Gemmatimonadaceae bacterium]
MDGHLPQYLTLSNVEARAVLARHHVGRIAYVADGHVDIEPIHFVADGEWLYGRTSIGTKLATLVHHPRCALEVDEIRGLFDWTSVVVKGTFHLLDPQTGSPDVHDRALALLGRLVPGMLTGRDPAPHRVVVFGIRVEQVTGRAARVTSD